jgi:uncharacterized RDD family membrane protein YckC
MSEADLTLNELLGGDEIRAKLRTAMRAAVGSAQVAALLSPQDLRPIMDEAQQALTSALNVTLNDILASAWSTVGKLREAADPGRHKPDETVVVPLIEHTVRSKQEPVLEFTYNGATVFTLSFTVELMLRLTGVVLRVRGGRIRDIASGTCSAAAALSLAGVKLIERTTREIMLPVRIHLGSGIPIIGPQRQSLQTPATLELPAAAVSLRVVAGILDVVIAMLILAPVSAALLLPLEQIIPIGILLWWITQLLPIVIDATPGMLMVGLRLTGPSGTSISMTQMMFRTTMLLATIITLRLRPDSQGLFMHDRVTDSRVVNEEATNIVASTTGL